MCRWRTRVSSTTGNVVAVVSMLVADDSEGTDSTALAAAQKAADRLRAS